MTRKDHIQRRKLPALITGTVILILAAFSLLSADEADYNRLLSKGERLFWIGEIDSVRIIGEMLVSQYPDRSGGYQLFAMYWISENEWDKAVDNGKEAVDRDKFSGMAHHWLGRSYALKARNSSKFRAAFLIDDIRQHFEIAAAMMPDYIRTHEDLFNFYSSAPSMAGGSKKNAQKELLEIERLDPFRGKEWRAKYYLSLGEEEKAVKEIEGAIALDSTNLAARWTKTYILMNLNPVSARRQLYEIKRISPRDSMRVLYQLGKTYLFANDSLQAGIDVYSKYINNEFAHMLPTYSTAFWRRGMLHEQAGDFQSALDDYEMCVSMNPDFSLAQNSLRDLKKKLR